MFSKRNLIILGVVILGIVVFFVVVRTGRNFVATEDAQKTFGEEVKVQREFIPLTEWGKRNTSKRKVSNEDFVVSSGVEIFADTEFLQSGNIIIEGSGKLIFRDSVIQMSPGEEPRANIFVRDNGEIVFENSTLKPSLHDPANLYVNLSNNGKFVFNNSQGIHMLIAGDNSTIEMNGSIWAFYLPTFRGGGVQLSGAAQADIKNSTIGGLVLDLPADARVNINGFKAKKFKEWSVQENLVADNVKFNAVFENVEILGDYYEGGSERGLTIFAPSDIRSLAVSDSELNKFVITSSDEDLAFNGLQLGVSSNFSYKNIKLTNSKVMAQWGFFMHGGSGNFTNSSGLWFFLYEDAKLTLKDSEMNEFDPRDFRGTIDFENVIWKNAGEIIGNNNFKWLGAWSAQGFDPVDFRPLLWDESKVTRKFPIDILAIDPEPAFVRAAKIEVFDKNDKLLSETYTDKSGRAYFSITFDDKNYRDKFYIKVNKEGKERKHLINFLTPTPVKLILK